MISNPLLLFLIVLLLALVSAQAPPFASLTQYGASCSGYPYQYKSCAYPLTFDVVSPSSLEGPIGYHPNLNSVSLPWEGIRYMRLLIPNQNEPNFGIQNNNGNIMGCGRVNSSAPYLSVNYPAFQYLTADDGTPFAGNAILLSRSTSCTLAVRNYLTRQLGVSLIIMAGVAAPSFPYIGNQPLPNNIGDGVLTDVAPMVALATADGQFLINQLRNNPTMNLTIGVKGAGRASAATRTILNHLASGITSTPTTATRNPNIRSWSDMANPSLDPCFNTIAGLWCELGEPVAIGILQGIFSFSGNLNDVAFSQLTSLKSLWISPTSRFTGPFPSSWCSTNNFQLSWIRITSQQFSSFPDCWDSPTSPKIVWAVLDGNAFTSYPMTLFRAPYLSTLGLSGNQKATAVTLPASFVDLPLLNYLDLSTNNFIGKIPSMTNHSSLTTVNLNNNPGLNDSIAADQFDLIPNLLTFQMSKCFAQGFLPNLQNSTRFLTTVDFSYNQFIGGIPAAWPGSWLSSLTSLPLRNNKLSRQFDPSAFSRLSLATKLTSLDLSNNRISNLPDVSPFHFIFAYLVSPQTVVTSVDLSNNLMGGRSLTNFLANLPTSISTINFGSNQITTLPNDLSNAAGIQFLNMSDNLIFGTSLDSSQTGPTAVTIPSVSSNMKVLDITMNPVVVPGGIPFLSIDRSQLSRSSQSVFSCYAIVGNSNFPALTVKIDSKFLGYTNCLCDAGFFGVPPNCVRIPVSNTAVKGPNLNPLSTPSFNNTLVPVLPGSFTDGWYGSNRALSGIDTVFSIDLRQFAVMSDGSFISWQPPADLPSGSDIPRTLFLNLYLDLNQFNQADDRILIYLGDDSLSGNLIKIISGSNSVIPSILRSSIEVSSLSTRAQWIVGNFSVIGYMRVPVFSRQVSVNFQSRAVAGVHFFATYTASSTCPTGFELTPDSSSCQAEVLEFQVSYGLRIAIFVLSGFVALLCVATMVICAVNGSTAIIKASSAFFTGITLISLFFLGATASLYAVVPSGTDGASGDQICSARLWCSCLSLMTVLGVLVAKSFRVSVIFGSKLLLQIRGVTNAYVASIVTMLVGTQLIMLIIFEAQDMTWARKGRTSGEWVWECATRNGFDAWMGVQIAIFASVMLAGAVVAFKTRSVPSAFNESSHILLSLQVLLIFMLLLVPLDWVLIDNSPNAAIVIQGGGQLLLAMFLLLSNFVPKLYFIFTGRANDKSLVFSNQGTKLSGSTASNSSVVSSSEHSSEVTLSSSGPKSAHSI